MRVICNQTCFWGTGIGRGQAVNVRSIDDIPPSVRPFFTPENEIKPVDDSIPADKLEGKEEKDETLPQIEGNDKPTDEVNLLRGQLDALGRPYDRKWGKDKLEQELTKAKRGT